MKLQELSPEQRSEFMQRNQREENLLKQL